jgi:hypothetical protein
MALSKTRSCPPHKLSVRKQSLLALEVATEFFVDQLTHAELHELAREKLEYLKYDESAAARLRYGYAPATFTALRDHLLKANFDLMVMEDIGLLEELGDEYVDAYRHRLVRPILDDRDRVVAFETSVLPATEDMPEGLLPEDAPDFLYSPASEIWKPEPWMVRYSAASSAASSVSLCIVPAKRQKLSKRTRFEVFKRDGFRCQYCGATGTMTTLRCDHIIAVANGGSNEMMNLITACDPCNAGKSQRLCREKELREKLQAERAVEEAESAALVKESAGLLPGFQLKPEAAAYGIREVGFEVSIRLLREKTAARYPAGARHLTSDEANSVLESWHTSVKWYHRNQLDPVGSSLRYTRGILLRKMDTSAVDSPRLAKAILAFLTAAVAIGQTPDQLRRLALDSDSVKDFTDPSCQRLTWHDLTKEKTKEQQAGINRYLDALVRLNEIGASR